MRISEILPVVFIAIAFVGAIALSVQIYIITLIDARERGLKHPRFWEIITIGGNNANGIILYLIGRRKHHIINISEADSNKIKKYKKSAEVALMFLCVGGIGSIISFFIS